MTPKISLITVVAVALVAIPAAWGQAQPDVFERTVAAQQRSTPIVSPDAVDRAVVAKLALQSTPIVAPDAVDRAQALQLSTQSRPSTAPDAFERAVAARVSTSDHFLANDNRFRIDPSKNPAPVSAASSGRELVWPQIGMGFGLGIVLALGLFVAMRYSRTRPLAH